MSDLLYISGFGNEFASEALPDALAIGQSSLQKVTYGLYAEQFSGTAFAMTRHEARCMSPDVTHVNKLLHGGETYA